MYEGFTTFFDGSTTNFVIDVLFNVRIDWSSPKICLHIEVREILNESNFKYLRNE